MVNVYIDDSGTAPSQRVAIASALIVPASRIRLLENEWDRFRQKFGIDEKGFHSSECAARNHNSEYAAWDDEKIIKAFDRVGAITMKYGIAAFSFAVKKIDYDDLMPEQWKGVGGYLHYTWAIKHVLRLLRDWEAKTDPSRPVEYFFDWQEGEPKQEIEKLIDMEESLRPGKYQGHYSFRRRKEVPALQCTDLLAWTSLSRARLVVEETPMNPYAERIRVKFVAHRDQAWLVGGLVKRGDLAETIRRHLVEGLPEDQKTEWYKLHASDCIPR
jgi:hypothetical protein